jgi:hypothetical protein
MDSFRTAAIRAREIRGRQLWHHALGDVRTLQHERA